MGHIPPEEVSVLLTVVAAVVGLALIAHSAWKVLKRH